MSTTNSAGWDAGTSMHPAIGDEDEPEREAMTLNKNTPQDERALLKEWATAAGLTFVNRSYAQYTTGTVCRDDLLQLIRAARLPQAAPSPAAPIGTLTISKFRGHLENTSFDYTGELPDGTYQVYTAPPDAGAAAGVENYKALYHELLFAVSRKWTGETRHQTALRYINNAEAAAGISTSTKEASNGN